MSTHYSPLIGLDLFPTVWHNRSSYWFALFSTHSTAERTSGSISIHLIAHLFYRSIIDCILRGLGFCLFSVWLKSPLRRKEEETYTQGKKSMHNTCSAKKIKKEKRKKKGCLCGLLQVSRRKLKCLVPWNETTNCDHVNPLLPSFLPCLSSAFLISFSSPLLSAC